MHIVEVCFRFCFLNSLVHCCFNKSKIMALSAVRRLMTEYKQLTLNPPEGILAGPVNEDNFFEWEAYVTGKYKMIS